MEGLRRGFQPEPTLISRRDAESDPSELATLLTEGEELQVPLLVPDHNWGLDGEISGIASDDYFNGFTAWWFCNGPATWKPFITWAVAVRDAVVRTLDAAYGGGETKLYE